MSHCQPGTGEHTRRDQITGVVGTWYVLWTVYCGYCHRPYRNYSTPLDGVVSVTTTGITA